MQSYINPTYRGYNNLEAEINCQQCTEIKNIIVVLVIARVTKMRGLTGALILEPAPSPYASSLKEVYLQVQLRLVLLNTKSPSDLQKFIFIQTVHEGKDDGTINPRLVGFETVTPVNPRMFTQNGRVS